jgi:hypothetical protein
MLTASRPSWGWLEIEGAVRSVGIVEVEPPVSAWLALFYVAAGGAGEHCGNEAFGRSSAAAAAPHGWNNVTGDLHLARHSWGSRRSWMRDS